MIVLLETVHPDALALLERADDVRLMAVPTALDDDVPLDEVRAVLTRGRGRITAEMCGRLPNLQVVGRCGAGLDNIDIVAAESSGIVVVHAPGRTTHAVSEHGLAADAGPRPAGGECSTGPSSEGKWEIREGYEGFELRGKRLGIIGLGAIGRRIAELGAALDMNVVYWSRASRDPNFELAGVGRPAVDRRCHPDLRRVDARDAGSDRSRPVRSDEARRPADQHRACPDHRSPCTARGDRRMESSAVTAPMCGTRNRRSATILARSPTAS